MFNRGGDRNVARNRQAGSLQEQIHASLAIQNPFFDGVPESHSVRRVIEVRAFFSFAVLSSTVCTMLLRAAKRNATRI
jgi:hypothetical protein